MWFVCGCFFVPHVSEFESFPFSRVWFVDPSHCGGVAGDCSGYSIFPGNDVERPVDYITIGDFIRKVRDAGYDYRLLDLRSVSDVFGVLDALERGDGLERFARKGALCSRISRKVECG